MNTPTMTNRRYSPKPAEEYLPLLPVVKSISNHRDETWNLMFLILQAEAKHPLNKLTDVPAAVWKTVMSDPRTGEFRNPYIPEREGKRIAHLLQQPASEFVAWAENSPVIDKLPLTKVMPDWVSRAKSRLHLCGDHAQTDLINQLDAPVDDVAQAAALLSKF